MTDGRDNDDDGGGDSGSQLSCDNAWRIRMKFIRVLYAVLSTCTALLGTVY